MIRVSWTLCIKDGDRPQPAGEPGVKDVFVLLEVSSCIGRIDLPGSFKGLFRSFLDNYLAIRQVVGGNPLSPPELAGNAPVVDILHPMTVGVAVLVRNELDPAGLDLVEGRCSEVFHLQEPLC